jgi:hypothetical protein
MWIDTYKNIDPTVLHLGEIQNKTVIHKTRRNSNDNVETAWLTKAFFSQIYIYGSAERAINWSKLIVSL